MKPKLLIDWMSYETAVHQLAERLTLAGIHQPKRIMGVPRGGLVPAVMLSHLLNVPMQTFNEHEIDEDVLLVDDICDTSKTIEGLLHCGQNRALVHCPHGIAVVVCKKAGYQFLEQLEVLSAFGMGVSSDEWIVFPYENEETEDDYDGTTR